MVSAHGHSRIEPLPGESDESFLRRLERAMDDLCVCGKPSRQHFAGVCEESGCRGPFRLALPTD